MAIELVQTKNRQIQNNRNALCSVSPTRPLSLLKVLMNVEYTLFFLLTWKSKSVLRTSCRNGALSPYMSRLVIATTSCSVGAIMLSDKQKAFANVFQKLRKLYSSFMFRRIFFLERRIISRIPIFFHSSFFSATTLSSHWVYESEGLGQVMSSNGHLWIWNHKAANGSLYQDGEMKESTLVVPWSREWSMRSRMNL